MFVKDQDRYPSTAHRHYWRKLFHTKPQWLLNRHNNASEIPSLRVHPQIWKALQVVIQHPRLWFFGCLIVFTRGSSIISFNSLDVTLFSGVFGLLAVALAALGKVEVISDVQNGGKLQRGKPRHILKAIGSIFLLRVLIPNPQLVLPIILPFLLKSTSSIQLTVRYPILVLIALVLSVPLSIIGAAYAFAEVIIVTHRINILQGFNAGFQFLNNHARQGIVLGYLLLATSVLGLPLTFKFVGLSNALMTTLHVSRNTSTNISSNLIVFLLTAILWFCNGIVEVWATVLGTQLYDGLRYASVDGD